MYVIAALTIYTPIPIGLSINIISTNCYTHHMLPRCMLTYTVVHDSQ